MELTHNSKPGQERKGKQGYLLFDYWDLEWSYLPDSQLGVPDEPRECIIVSEEGHVVYAPLASPGHSGRCYQGRRQAPDGSVIRSRCSATGHATASSA